jgi:SAM-dependent methyltransferase
MSEATWERQRRSFERTAAEYDRYRPTYPPAIFEEIEAYADLAPDDRILEFGAGTGRATLQYAAWGNPILAIEPAPAMADVARANLAAYANVEIVTATLEDAVVDAYSFGLVTGAQAFHWLDPATRVERIANALYAYGTVALVDNVQVVPDDHAAFFIRAQDVYLDVAPDLAHEGPFRKPDDIPNHRLAGSMLFVDPEQRTHRWEWTLDASTYVALLQTHSSHASLDPDVRRRLVERIGTLIDVEFGGHVTEHYVCLVDLARRTA